MVPVTVSQSRRISAPQADVHRITVPIDLALLFRRWYGPIPPIKAVRGQNGTSSSPGQTRTVLLVGRFWNGYARGALRELERQVSDAS